MRTRSAVSYRQSAVGFSPVAGGKVGGGAQERPIWPPMNADERR